GAAGSRGGGGGGGGGGRRGGGGGGGGRAGGGGGGGRGGGGGGRRGAAPRREAAGAPSWASASEVLAHECGHTRQARRLGWLYLPTGALFTAWGEGERRRNWFENQASAEGRFGGLVHDPGHTDPAHLTPHT